MTAATGPPHRRTFEVAAIVDSERVGAGEGRSKKAAEQVAAERRSGAGRLGLAARDPLEERAVRGFPEAAASRPRSSAIGREVPMYLRSISMKGFSPFPSG